MKAIIKTASNYGNLNESILEVISTGDKTVTCKLPEDFDGPATEADFTHEEVILVHEIPQTEKGEAMSHEDNCVCCGKKTNKTLWIHACANLWEAVNCDEEKLSAFGYESQGSFPIGPDCAKKFPKGFVIEWEPMQAIVETMFGTKNDFQTGTGFIKGAEYSNFNFQIEGKGEITLQFHGHGTPGVSKETAIYLLRTALENR